MKTDNSNIVVQESLEDAAKKYSKDFIPSHYNSIKESFKRGANWQKEQLLPLIDELKNDLIRINSISDTPNGGTWNAEFSLIKKLAESAIEKVNNLIKP